jgi:hypothetical protein
MAIMQLVIERRFYDKPPAEATVTVIAGARRFELIQFGGIT